MPWTIRSPSPGPSARRLQSSVVGGEEVLVEGEPDWAPGVPRIAPTLSSPHLTSHGDKHDSAVWPSGSRGSLCISRAPPASSQNPPSCRRDPLLASSSLFPCCKPLSGLCALLCGGRERCPHFPHQWHSLWKGPFPFLLPFIQPFFPHFSPQGERQKPGPFRFPSTPLGPFATRTAC